jgi:cytochrome c-type biogenesis protein CcmH/NrfG
MSRPEGSTSTTTRQSAARIKSDLLARLGLDPEADEEAVETTHDQIVEYLEAAPSDIRGWADRRQQEIDRIFDLLTAPESQLQTIARQAPQQDAAAPSQGNRTNRTLLGVIAVLVTIGVVVGIYWVGRPSVPDVSATAAQNGTSQTTGLVDQAKLAALTSKVAANPKDIASLQAIADLYFNANDWANAKQAAQEVLAVDPKNEQGLISVGAAAYNGGDTTTAEKVWKTGVQLHPKNAELHYDLGFLYMTTGRSAQMRTEWAQVVAIAPNSDLAKTVQSQVGAVGKPTAAATK